MSLVERVTGNWPGVPVKDRRLHYQGVVKNLFSAEELELKRKHGRAIQARLFADRAYQIEAAATAEPADEGYENGQ